MQGRRRLENRRVRAERIDRRDGDYTGEGGLTGEGGWTGEGD